MGLGQSPSANPGPGDREWWDRERERQFRSSVGGALSRIVVVGQPRVSLRDPAQLAGEVVKVLREWLTHHARPHRLRGAKAFVDREEPYRALKGRVLQGFTSVVSGPSGTGKSTLTEALSADQDVAREYALPAIEVAVDLTVPSPAQTFRQDVEGKLAAREKSSPGARFLLVVTLSAVLDTGTRQENEANQENEADVAQFISRSFARNDQVDQRCTLIFEVPDRPAARLICRYLDPGEKDMHIAVPDLPEGAAIDLLLVMDGLHYECMDCDRLGPSVVAAAGCWPPLLTLCASSFAELGHRDDQHEYLRHAGQAFNGLLTARQQMYKTFRWQKSLLKDKHEEAHDVLEAVGVLLPRPFAFSQDLIRAVSGLPEQATGRALKTLTDRQFLERAERPERAASDTEPEFTIHPFFWVFLRRQSEEVLADGGSARKRAEQFRKAASDWLNQKINETFDDEFTYQGWFELERPERQALMANWVYQLAHLDDRRRAAEELARIFLKACWWWGYYLPFGFCELLNELGSKAVDLSPSADGDDLGVVAQALRTFYDKYPRGGQFDSPPAAADARKAWRRTKQALIDIATQLEISVDEEAATVRRWAKAEAAHTGGHRDKARRDKVRWEIAKLLHIFLAHCEQCFFGETLLDDQALRKVERHCESAVIIAKQQGDDWNQPWILCVLGDAELDAAKARRGSPAAFRRTEAACLKKARVSAEKALRLARKQCEHDDGELDFEILSICERLLGDVGWHIGDQEAAVQHYARAVHYAHCFEVWPEHQPDLYTRTFEREQRWRVSTPLLEMAEAGGDGAVLRTLSGQIAAFLGTDPGAAWEHLAEAVREQQPRKAGTVVNALFAPYLLPPSDDDLERRDERARGMIDKFRSEAAEMIRSTEWRHPDLVRLPAKPE